MYGKIWKFLNDGYNAANLGQFSGCDNGKSLLKNACLIRIASYKDIWVAVSVYTNYKGGQKNVGITATTDKMFRSMGINAVHQIIQLDIASYKEFYWIECSGTIEKLYDKYDGIKIPSDFAKDIVGGDATPIGGNDLYHYKRTIGGETLTKVIYGFNSIETFNAVKKEFNDYINKCIANIEKHSLNENYSHPSIMKLIAKINIFVDLRWESNVYEMPQEQIDFLKETLDILEKELINCPNDKLEMAKMAIENGKDILETTVPLELHIYKVA